MKRLLTIILLLTFGTASLARALVAGDLGDAVLSYQHALACYGYLEGTLDGVFGEQTQNATQRLRAYARSQGKEFPGSDTEAPDELVNALLNGDISPVCSAARAGDTSELTIRVQRRLRTLGYLSDKADGYFGENTRRAVAVYQVFEAIPVTGEADAQTQTRLFSETAVKPARAILSKGARNKRVLEMQARLKLLGFFTGDEDGQYGNETVSGVKAIQEYIAASDAFGNLDASVRAQKPNGIADPLLLQLIFADDFPVVPSAIANGGEGPDVYRVQRRLIALGYLTDAPDGGYGEHTAEAMKAFQKRSKLEQSGLADAQTLSVLFSSDAKEAIKPYKLVISLSKQSVTVYAINKKGAYDKRVSHFSCSTGLTQTDSYKAFTRPLAKWVAMDDEQYVVKYAFQLERGLMIHSIPYDQKDGTPDRSYLSTLGQAVSTQNIILAEENAKLIYQKCPAGTPVEIIA